MPRTPSARGPLRSAGQSVYEVMLIVACAAMLLAVIFAAQEYFSFYHGPTNAYYKFESTAATPPVSRPPTPTPRAAPTPARTVTPAPAPATTPTSATTAAPAPAPIATPETTPAPAATTP